MLRIDSATKSIDIFESELESFNFIFDERTNASLELDQVLIKDHSPEQYETVRE
ncbi:MAG: hypothetical protein H0V27_08455 [Pyrinomonadaceae bacterium]|nr:hypothetical protein [Pyrinomonadaceae bacterium]